jgi:sugar phosphate permease
MEFYRDILLVIHIAAAGAWLGANVIQAIVPGVLGPESSAAAGWFRTTEKLSGRFYIPVGVTVLVTGVLLVLQSDLYGFGSTFVSIGFVAVVIGAVLGSVVFGPKSIVAADAIDAGDMSLASKTRGTLSRFGTLDTLVLLFTMYAMVSKLGA